MLELWDVLLHTWLSWRTLSILSRRVYLQMRKKKKKTDGLTGKSPHEREMETYISPKGEIKRDLNALRKALLSFLLSQGFL